jgi:uncharacterized membrane protein
MTKVETSVIIEAPLEKVYAYASDWRNFKRYFVYVRDVRPLTEKTIGEGARLELKVRFRGLGLTSEWRGLEATENVGWTFDAKLMGRWATKRWRFTPVNDSTRATFTLEYQPPPPPIIGRLFDALFIRPEWERLYKGSFETLKQLMEADAGSVEGRLVEGDRTVPRETPRVG